LSPLSFSWFSHIFIVNIYSKTLSRRQLTVPVPSHVLAATKSADLLYKRIENKSTRKRLKLATSNSHIFVIPGSHIWSQREKKLSRQRSPDLPVKYIRHPQQRQKTRVRIGWAVAHAEGGSTLAAPTLQWTPLFASHRTLIAFGFVLNVYQIW
jgi:hypothetical protein